MGSDREDTSHVAVQRQRKEAARDQLLSIAAVQRLQMAFAVPYGVPRQKKQKPAADISHFYINTLPWEKLHTRNIFVRSFCHRITNLPTYPAPCQERQNVDFFSVYNPTCRGTFS
jgi:hypothetical protein